MPVTRPAAGASLSYRSQAASGDSSRNGDPVEQPVDALAHRQLALRAVPLDVLRRRRPARAAPSARAARRRARGHRGSAIRSRNVGSDVVIDVRLEDVAIYHPQQSVLKRHFGQRQTACIRNISAPHRSHITLSSPARRAGRSDRIDVRIGSG